jgi:hypothetical protein
MNLGVNKLGLVTFHEKQDFGTQPLSSGFTDNDTTKETPFPWGIFCFAWVSMYPDGSKHRTPSFACWSAV